MKLYHRILLILPLLSFSEMYTQSYSSDDADCPITQSELLLDGQYFANVPPIFFRVYNENYEYATLQLGKRKRRIFLFFKIFTDNTCIRQEQPLEFYFEDGQILSLKNQFKVNCDGNVVLELTKRERKAIKSHMINKIKLFTLHKDYEFSPTDVDNRMLREYLSCFQHYRVKRI